MTRHNEHPNITRLRSVKWPPEPDEIQWEEGIRTIIGRTQQHRFIITGAGTRWDIRCEPMRPDNWRPLHLQLKNLGRATSLAEAQARCHEHETP